MTPQQRNERIAVEVCGWEQYNELFWIAPGESTTRSTPPNFIGDETTMATIENALVKKGNTVTYCQNGSKGVSCYINGSLSDYGDGIDCHAALIAAVEVMIEETPDAE